MRLFLALLSSLALHLALLAAPALWRAAPPAPPPRLEVTLSPPETPELKEPPLPSAVNTEADSPLPEPTPRLATGGTLRRAQGALSKHLFYPPQAVAQGLEGDVVVLLELAPDGRILKASVATGSGHALLDDAALDAARRIGRLPGNPRQMLLPVSFRLQ